MRSVFDASSEITTMTTARIEKMVTGLARALPIYSMALRKPAVQSSSSAKRLVIRACYPRSQSCESCGIRPALQRETN